MFFLVVGKTQIHVSHCWFFGLPNIRHDKISNWDRKVDILTNLRCHLQMANLEKLIFVNKNWPNDLKLDYKSHFNLVELIENNLKLED